MSSNLFRSLLEFTPDAVIIIDQRGIITCINSPAEKLFGYGREELLGKPVERLVPERLRERHQEHRATYSANPWLRPMGSGLELVAVRRDGSEFLVEISLSPVETGQEVLVAAAVRDITARKQAERLLQQKERLANLGNTAAVFAHEIGNPLNGISTSLQIIKSVLSSGYKQDPVLTETLEIAFQEVQRLASLLSDYRMLARPQRLNLKPVDLNRIAEEILAAETRSDDTSSIAVKTDLDDALPPILMDREKVKHAISNLCRNARQAMPNGGTLTVKTSSAPASVILEVSHTGDGLADGVDVFELFATARHEATGLELPIAKQVIRDHGGTVDYFSELGSGATFRVVLPLARQTDD